MKMVKCIKGHVYNAEKFDRCPYCTSMEADGQMAASLEGMQEDIDTEDPSTVMRQKYEIVGRRKVAGCLICTKGIMMGEGFFLVEGHNDIGRNANLEVALTKEVTVSRKAHACIIYDADKNRYLLKAAEGKKDVLCNGMAVDDSTLLESNCVIEIGQCSLRFIAFCDDDFMWGKGETG